MYVQLGEDVAYILINNSCVKFEFYGQYVAFVFFCFANFEYNVNV